MGRSLHQPMPRASSAAAYWDMILTDWVDKLGHSPWRNYCDHLHLTLLQGWLPARVGTILKTDLFEEAVGDGLAGFLSSRADRVIAFDISPVAVKAARERHRALDVRLGDVRALELETATVDVVVSTSTLDHFESLEEVSVALRELNRVIAPGGALLVTMDNWANPVLQLRKRLPFSWLRRLRLVPYRAGASCGPRRLRMLLHEAGFDSIELTAVMHCPRVIAVPIGARLEGASARRREGFIRALMRFEVLRRFPTRWLTGHYVAARAQRPVEVVCVAKLTQRCYPPS